MKNKIAIFLILTLAVFALSAKKCGKSENEPILTVYSQTQQRTPNGVLVASQSGVSAELKQAIDEEFARIFADVAPRNYQIGISYSAYIIYVLPNCVLSPESQTRSFLIRADVYDGTIFDQDPRPGIGKIYAAEYVIGGGGGNSYVVCNAPSADEDFRNSVRYGMEHILLYFNDRPEFDRTWFHGNGGVSHPLIPRLEPNTDRRETPKKDVVDYGGRVKIIK